MRLAVTGGRDYQDVARVYEVLDWFHSGWPVTLLIHGAARGADSLCALWAASRGVTALPFPVSDGEWQELGKKAGPLRNSRMIREGHPEWLLRFPGGRGTKNMADQCRLAGIPVTIVD